MSASTPCLDTWSIRLDVSIILETIPAVISGRGAYREGGTPTRTASEGINRVRIGASARLLLPYLPAS